MGSRADNLRKERLNQIPVLYVRGDNYTVGFTIGRQFKSLIQDSLPKSDYLQENLLPDYDTETGKELYKNTLELCEAKFPEYVQELRGMAEGAGVPFHHLFLLNIEVFVTSFVDFVDGKNKTAAAAAGSKGCSSIMSNGLQLLMGHTEDAGSELLNNVFIVSAEILNSDGEKVEKFTTLTYAGCLPGYTMGYNEHGFIHTVNTLYSLQYANTKTPRGFIARAILKAKNLEEVIEIVKDKGMGIADGFHINACFASGIPQFYSIEICPDPDADESKVNILEIKSGETYTHCNIYLRIDTPQLPKLCVSSTHRHEAIQRLPKPETFHVLQQVLSDRSDHSFPIFRMGDEPSGVVTVAAGIFDITKRKWNIYAEPPNHSEPLVVLPLDF